MVTHAFNFVPPDVSSFVPEDVLNRVDGYVAKHYKDRPPVSISDYDRNRAMVLLKPLLEQANADKVAFDQKIIDIARRSMALGQMLAEVKSMDRSAEKLITDEGFNVGGMKDMLRSTIVVRSYADAAAVVDEIRKEFKVLRVLDRAAAGIKGDDVKVKPREAQDGYADVLVSVNMPSGLIAEIQINVPEMLGAKGKQGHRLYEVQREAGKETPRGIEIGASMREFYDAAFSAGALNADGGLSRNVIPPRGAPARPSGSLVSNNSDSSSENLNQRPSGNMTNSSPPKVGTNSQPGGNLSGTFMDSPLPFIVDETGAKRYTSGSTQGAADANNNPGQGSPETQGAGTAQKPEAKRGIEPVRDGLGGADRRGGDNSSDVDSQSPRLQQDPGRRPTEGSGNTEHGQVDGARDSLRGPAGVPSGLDGRGRDRERPGVSGDVRATPVGRDIPVKSGRNYEFGPADLTYAGSWFKKAEQNVAAVALLKQLNKDARQATRDEQKALAQFVGWGASDLANNLFGKKLDKPAEILEKYKSAIAAMDKAGIDTLQGNRKNIYGRGHQAASDGYWDALHVIRSVYPQYQYDRDITRAELEKAKPDNATKRWVDLRDKLNGLLTADELAEASRSTQYAHYTSKAVVQSMWRAMERMGFKGGSILEPGAGIGVFPGLMSSAMATNSVTDR